MASAELQLNKEMMGNFISAKTLARAIYLKVVDYG